MRILEKIKDKLRHALGVKSPSLLYIYGDTTDEEQLKAKAIEYLQELNQKTLQYLTEQTDPCETCLRWPECNGVDADTCPLCGWEEKKIQENKKAVPAYLDDRTESGLLEE